MKKIVLGFVAFIFSESIGLAQTAQKQVPTANAVHHTHKKNAYHCPMKCMEDKKYSKAGKCEKCGMKLTKVESKAK